MAEAAANSMGALNLSGAQDATPMDTSERNVSQSSSGIGSMGANGERGRARWERKKEKEAAKKRKVEEDEAIFLISRPAVVDRELRNRGVQMEMTRGCTLRKTEKQLGERRSGQHPELGEGEDAWKGAAEKLKVGVVQQGETSRNVLKTKKRMVDGKAVKKRQGRLTGAGKRRRKSGEEALEAKVAKERAAMEAVEVEKGQLATATSTPKPNRQKQPPRQQQQTQQPPKQPWRQQHQTQRYQQQPQRQQQQTQRHQQQWDKPSQRPHQ